jgi:hypothetical protein
MPDNSDRCEVVELHAPYGPPLSPQQFRSPFDEVVAEVVRKGLTLHESFHNLLQPQWKNRLLEINIVDNPDLNAFATKRAGSDCIYIFRGALESIYGNLLGLFSTPAFLPGIGDVACEVGPANALPGGFPSVPLLRNVGKLEQGLYSPKDKIRLILAEAMAEVAFEFLICHEIGHIVGGHLELCQANSGSSTISEFAQADTEAGDWNLRHVLECDADAFAGHVTAWVQTENTVADAFCSAMNWPERQSTELALLTYLTSIGVLFRLLSPDAPRMPRHGEYPHPAVRACLVASAAMARVVHDGKLTASSLNDIVRASIGNLEEVWANVCLPEEESENGTSWSETVGQAAMDLFSAYGAQKSLLDQYARVPRRWDTWQWPETNKAT